MNVRRKLEQIRHDFYYLTYDYHPNVFVFLRLNRPQRDFAFSLSNYFQRVQNSVYPIWD
jgi:hypothetical protein